MGLKVSLEKVASLRNIELEIGEVESVRNLAVAPLYGDDSFKENALLINEAIEKAETKGKFAVIESNDRDFLTIRNDLSEKIFISEGEIIEGSSQNRMAVYSTLIPAKAGEIYLPVRCVQRSRGLENSSRYSGSNTVIMPALRGNDPDKTWLVRNYSRHKDDAQHRIWDNVTTVTRVLNRTQILDSRDIRQENFCDVLSNAKLNDYLDDLKKSVEPNQIGYVAAICRSDGGFDLYTDFFGNQQHLSGLYERLLKSVAFVAQLHNQDSIAKHKRELVLEKVDEKTFSPFLQKISQASIDTVPKVGEPKHFAAPEDVVAAYSNGFGRRTIGEGDLYRLKGAVDGSSLVLGEKYVQTFAKVILN